MDFLKCSYPKLCLWYFEIENANKSKKPICLFHDIDINYHNKTKIETCEHHITYKKLQEKWYNWNKNVLINTE
jgi:hypothetical protein